MTAERQNEPSAVERVVSKKLNDARNALIDRNLRNKLISCPLRSTRAKQVRVIDERPDEVFRHLLGSKRDFVFSPGLSGTTVSDENGEHQIEPWTPPVDGGLSGGVESRHKDNALQTTLTPDGLQSRLNSLYYEAIDIEEEQGVNVLYLALGVLKWFEDGRSEIERYAPLILLPVELYREGARERFKLKARDEELFTNVSLKIWLAEQHAITLPEIPDDDEWSPSGYFEQVREAVKKNPRWEVLDSEILLSFFSFSKFMLWRDLDPKNWPSEHGLLGHQILRSLLGPADENDVSEAPIISENERVDTLFRLSGLGYVLDADSSQTVAIQTALAGRNLVIQGPPGTGKSQTITNLIAAAIAQGKSVLFVAEKLAALQVVFDRLKQVGLAHLCLELHSRKSSKQQVLKQLKEAIDARLPPAPPQGLKNALDQSASTLWEHSDRFHRSIPPSQLTPFQILGRVLSLKDKGVSTPDFTVKGALTLDREALILLEKQCTDLQESLLVSGVPARHPWRSSGRGLINPLDQDRLERLTQPLNIAVKDLVSALSSAWPVVRRSSTQDSNRLSLRQIEYIVDALKIAEEVPSLPLNVVCNPSWDRNQDRLAVLVACGTRLANIEQSLKDTFIPSAWEFDWFAARASIAADGASLLRIFKADYRKSIKALRGFTLKCPGSRESKIKAIDDLIEGQRLKKEVDLLFIELETSLAGVSRSSSTVWSTLEALCAWLKKASEVDAFLAVRNRALLESKEQINLWGCALSGALEEIKNGTALIRDFVSLDDSPFASPENLSDLSIQDLEGYVSGWVSSGSRFNEWPPVRDGLRWLESITDASLATKCYLGEIPATAIADLVRLAVAESLWNSCVSRDPMLAMSDGRSLNETLSNFRLTDKKVLASAAEEVARSHFLKKPTGSVGDMAIVRAELNKSRKLMPVRKLLDRAGHAIQQLKPAFLMSPLSVAQYLAPGRTSFDLLVIDEASQIPPADALGAVARATQVVVVGDPKQLPPTNFFNRLIDEADEFSDDQDAELETGAPLGSMESILSLCDTAFSNRRMLEWHYRSHHPGLIAVSNRRFYDNRLLLPPSVIAESSGEGLGVVFHRTPSGFYQRGGDATNVVEAGIVADAVCSFAKKYPDKSLGVGTFSVRQRDAIRDLIDSRRRADPSLEPFFSASRPHPFFVKNLESIQGDERDVIYISVAYGRDKDGRLTQSFGPINKPGGERRLNVLISRARERCEVFSSISGDEIDIANGSAGAVALREFLQYAEKGYFDVPESTDRSFDSDFEESVASFIQSQGLLVHPQVGMAGFRIDLGILDPSRPTRYLLGIECDGATYHSSKSARDRDRIRQEILEARGWKIYRIWSTDWFHRRAREQQRLLDAIATASLKGANDTDEAETPLHEEGHIDCGQHDPVQAARSYRNELPITYEEAGFRVNSDVLPGDADIDTLRNAMLKIVEIEGPIVEEEACRRLATVWGLERAGTRIRSAGRRTLRSLVERGLVVLEDACYTAVGSTPVVVRSRANVKSVSLKQASSLPFLEIKQAVVDILTENVRVSRNELVVEVSRRFGFQRTGEDLRGVIDQVCSELINKGVIALSSSYVTLPAKS